MFSSSQYTEFYGGFFFLLLLKEKGRGEYTCILSLSLSLQYFPSLLFPPDMYIYYYYRQGHAQDIKKVQSPTRLRILDLKAILVARRPSGRCCQTDFRVYQQSYTDRLFEIEDESVFLIPNMVYMLQRTVARQDDTGHVVHDPADQGLLWYRIQQNRPFKRSPPDPSPLLAQGIISSRVDRALNNF